MQYAIRSLSTLGSLMLALAATTARADDGLTVTVLNNSTDDLIVTIYDLNLKSRQAIVSARTISGSSSIAVQVSPNHAGLGHVSWSAVTKDRYMGACGHGDSAKLHGGDTVNVEASGECHRHSASP